MPREPNDKIRNAILDRAFDYVCEHGVAEFSLRPLAKAIDTTPGALLYHFGSRDELLVAIVRVGRVRQQAIMARFDFTNANPLPSQIGTAFWRAWSVPEVEPFVRMFFEVSALAMQDRSRFPGFLRQAFDEWLTPLQQTLHGYTPADSRALATVILDGFRGFQLDLCATGDRPRINRAVKMWLAMLDDAFAQHLATRRRRKT